MPLFINCSKDDEPSSEDDGGGNPISSKLRLEIEGLENIDFEDYQVLSSTQTTSINGQGEFDNISDSNNDLILPLLFVQNEKVLFGLYPDTSENSTFSISHVLLFYLSLHPEVSTWDFNNTQLSSNIPSLTKKKELKSMLLEALNQEQDPLENPEFVELYNLSAIELTNLIFNNETSGSNRTQSNSTKEYIEDFEINYKRNGGIIIPTEVPLFANVAFEIKNVENETYIAQNHIMKPKAISLDIGSYTTWLGQQLFPETAPPENKNFNLSEDGTYEIKFTNGVGDDDLAGAAKRENNKYITITLLKTAAPKILKSVVEKSPDCSGILEKMDTDLALEIATYSANPPSADDLKELAINTTINLASELSTCVVEEGFAQYASKFLGKVNDVLSKAAVASNLIFFTRDYFSSNIQGSETRYFSNGVSFGELDLINQNGYEFTGTKDDEFLYEATVKEKVTKYEVHRNLTYSEFKPKNSMVKANQLPFKIELVSGDAKIDSEVELTHDGTLFSLLTMGEEISQVKISPDFSTTHITPESIILSPEDIYGINLNGNFYPFKYVYIDYNYDIIEDPDYPYVRYVHVVYFSPEPFDFNNPDPNYDYLMYIPFLTNQSATLPAGEYESNMVGFELGRELYVEAGYFMKGGTEAEIYLGSLYEEIEPNHYDWKKRGYINLSWDGNQTIFDFQLYNSDEELVDGLIKAEIIEIELPDYD
jgi:hypothetical protein